MPRAITLCRGALELVNCDSQPGLWATWQVQLGNSLYQNPQGERARNLEEAIRCYERALEIYRREDFPEDWAGIQNRLAIAYSDRVLGARAQNLEEAIRCCELALEVYTRQDFPKKWAGTQNQLGIAYRYRILGEKASNLEEAIRHYELALEELTHGAFPEQWAEAQNNLANAYVHRILGERANNLQEAIRHYELALEVRTREDFPEKWAATQNNLGIAYRNHILRERAENLEEAIRCYERALEVYRREDFPEKWATTQNNLAAAYSERILGEKANNLEEAIRCHGRTLEVYTREAFREWWARTQHNLAITYSLRILGERANNLEEAIRHCELALEVYTREDFPENWASTQHNLANAYRNRIWGERPENLEEAIRCYERALEVRTAEAFPQDCRDTAYALGSLLYDEQRRFAKARTAFTTAHEAIEALRGEIQREGAVRNLGEQNALLYARLVHCCLLEGDEEAAFKYAVAGKGRAFVDMLATARFDLSAAGADDPKLAEDLRQAQELRRQIDDLMIRLSGDDGPSSPDGTERRSPVEMRADLRALREQHAALWEEMAYEYPALTATQQAPAFAADGARALAGDLGATLVEYYRHADGWCAFVATQDEVRHVPLPDINDDLLGRMTKWLKWVALPSGRGELSYGPLRWLHEAVIAPLRPHLSPDGRVVLAPFFWLHLVPLGAALDPSTGRYAAEDYRLAFAPSLAALRVARDQSQRGASSTDRQEVAERLLSVAYPDRLGSKYYLPNVLPEAEAVAKHFARITRLHEDAATPEAVLEKARGQGLIHLGCHGLFDRQYPEQSGLKLSGGWLTVQGIITGLRLDRTRLVTIGACLSGQVDVRQGEEHVGLVQAVMSAGAGAVVASLW